MGEMRILVIGAGAIGTLVGGKLQQAGHRVTLVGRQALADAVRDHGLILREDDHAAVVREIRVVLSIDQALAAGEGFDLALLTVKAYDTAAAAQELRSALDARAPTWADALRVLTLQNGVGNEETLLQWFTRRQIIAGAITTPVTVSEPGRVTVTRRDRAIGLSPVDPACALDDVAHALTQAGFEVTRYPDYRGLKWTKLLMNITANASAAILNWPPGQIFADRRLAAMEIAAWREALAVMRALGVRPVRLGRYRWPLYAPLVRFLPAAVLRPFVRRVASGGRGGKMPSLHIDLYRGRTRSEVDWLNGAVVRHGRQAGVPTPVNQALTDILSALVARRIPRDAFAHRPDRLCSAVDAVRAGRDALSALNVGK